MTAHANLAELFLRSAKDFPDRPALWVNGETVSYTGLLAAAKRYAAPIVASPNFTQGPVGIFAQRSLPAYAGVLAATLCQAGFVPLNPRFPAERLKSIAELSGLKFIVADDANANAALELSKSTGSEASVLLPEVAAGAKPDASHELAQSSGDATAYIMFTSGSTGVPKGVRVLEPSVCRYVASVIDLLKPGPNDRFTQLFDFSFDLSVHDLFVTWAAGGCLYVLPQEKALNPIAFVRERELTHWFSVPATAALAQKLRQLTPNAMPSLRVSLFCGEALPQTIADSWLKAAPNSALYNFYGPTEATIAFTTYRYRLGQDLAGETLVPIGSPLPEQEVVVARADGTPANSAEEGELYLGGSQLAAGYINNEAANREKFINRNFAGRRSERWYRTGDLVVDVPKIGLVFKGRTDDQVKINGYRVELLEIESILRREAGTELVAAIAWPVNESGLAEGVVAFTCGATKKTNDIIKACSKALPFYMTPRKIIAVEEMPQSASGKIDRKALKRLLSEKPAAAKP